MASGQVSVQSKETLEKGKTLKHSANGQGHTQDQLWPPHNSKVDPTQTSTPPCWPATLTQQCQLTQLTALFPDLKSALDSSAMKLLYHAKRAA